VLLAQCIEWAHAKTSRYLEPLDGAAHSGVEREFPVDLEAQRCVDSTPANWAPPASGVTVLQILALLERFPLASYAPLSPEALHLLAEAERVAFADREAWLADPDFVAVPTAGLLAPAYVAERAGLITQEHALGTVKPGRPPTAQSQLAPARSPELPATSHFSIVDRDGNIACATSSIEFAFGSHVMVDGFLLNNQLTDFSFRPTKDGQRVANAVAPGKRPRSAMSPTIIFEADSGRPVAAIGSPGGPAIVGYIVQTIVALLDWKLSPQAAVALPHIVNRNGRTELETSAGPVIRRAKPRCMRSKRAGIRSSSANKTAVFT
jgi:gamma-glutamyltranspeptidase/glutathione hydrolase